MKKKISKSDQAIIDMDFSKMENHFFAKPVEYDYLSGPGYLRHYSSPAMDALGLRLVVDILGIHRVSYGIWSIAFNCYIYDGWGSLQERFSLNSRVHSDSYIDAWGTDCPDDLRPRDAYDMLFSQLDEDRLHEKCMGYVERLGESEQERIVDIFNL